MQKPINYAQIAPEGFKAMRGLEACVRSSGLDHGLLELVKTRVSQLNGCAFCVDMHTKDARAEGETEQRLYALAAWREAPFYSAQERAALAWAEALASLAHGGLPGALRDEALRSFSEKELVDLTFAIIAINGWNRLAIPFHPLPVGSYQVGQFG
ncbi:MAG TPA: carboxymuconolactone decarboxylase family protein [Gallionellaceae bacterium]|nr:carboxymuconolactone decarboxylase family protein [Gallionellaceae bacterium]